MPADTHITEDQMRAQWARTRLARDGMSYEKGMTIPGMRVCLRNAIIAARRTDQRRALAHPVTHHKEAG